MHLHDLEPLGLEEREQPRLAINRVCGPREVLGSLRLHRSILVVVIITYKK